MAINAVLVAGQTKLMRREKVAEGTMAFHVEKPSGFTFKAGQFADLTLTNPPETDTGTRPPLRLALSGARLVMFR